MDLGDLCICRHTREVHFGAQCTILAGSHPWEHRDCPCKQFVELGLAVEIFEALKALEEQVADFRAGRTWDADYIGLKRAHLKAKAAIHKAEIQ